MQAGVQHATKKGGAREASRYTGPGGKDAAELTEGFTTKKQLVLASLAAVDHLFIMRRLCAHSGGTDIEGSGKNNAGMSGKKTVEPGSTIGASWRTDVHISSTLTCSLPAPVTTPLLLQTH